MLVRVWRGGGAVAIDTSHMAMAGGVCMLDTYKWGPGCVPGFVLTHQTSLGVGGRRGKGVKSGEGGDVQAQRIVCFKDADGLSKGPVCGLRVVRGEGGGVTRILQLVPSMWMT